MARQILITLKQKLDDLKAEGLVDAEILRNAAKEEIQYYALDFVYHHPEYSKWIMYGGSALRICHGLNRMSVDLDFEIDNNLGTGQCPVPTIVAESFLTNLQKEIKRYFLENYELGPDMLNVKIINGRGLLLRFIIGEELGIQHHSKQIHIKIDLNQFILAKTVIERIPINHDQLAFVIKTYNMSALMASKITAIFLRGTRGVDKELYEEKGRDIYDLLWYMEKKIIPDLDYLAAKNIPIKDLRNLFDRLTLKMNKVSNENLRQDLSPLFRDQNYIGNWIDSWHESYLRLVKTYDIRTIVGLREIIVHEELMKGVFLFKYVYDTEDGGSAFIVYAVSDYWIYREGELSIEIDELVNRVTQFSRDGVSSRHAPREKLKQYATLFYGKNTEYFKKTNKIILGDVIQTKFIRMTTDKLNQKEQIVPSRSALISCELEDLLK